MDYSAGHVPHTGFDALIHDAEVLVSKLLGVDGMLDTHHPLISWLNEDAPLNMYSMFVTLDTSHPPIGWLNEDARSNITRMVVTLDTSHPPIG